MEELGRRRRSGASRSGRARGSSAFLLVALLVAGALPAVPVEGAPPPLAGWSFRRAVDLVNGGAAQTDYPVRVTFDSAAAVSRGHLRPDCGDLRFADADDATLLVHSLEGGCNTSATVVLVRVPDLPSGAKRIFLYHGNPEAASASSRAGVAVLFEDFESYPAGTIAPGLWSNQQQMGPGGTAYVQVRAGAGHQGSQGLAVVGTTAECAGIARERWSRAVRGVSLPGATLDFDVRTAFSHSDGRQVAYFDDRLGYSQPMNGAWTRGSLSTASPFTLVKLGLHWPGLYCGGYDVFFDNVRLLKFASPEPSASVGPQEGGLPTPPPGGWAYRRPVTVSNGGGALSDHQVAFTLDSATLIDQGKMRSDCGDLRVTDQAGAFLAHWLESGCDTGATRVWARVPSIPAQGSRLLYALYGNAAASSASSGSAVFDFYDDFEGYADGTVNPGGWAVEQQNLAPNYGYASATAKAGQGTAGSRGLTVLLVATECAGVPRDRWARAVHAAAMPAGVVEFDARAHSQRSDAYQRAWVDGALIWSQTWQASWTPVSVAVPSGFGSVRVGQQWPGLYCGGLEVHYDNVRVRRHASPQPTAAVGAEEPVPGPASRVRPLDAVLARHFAPIFYHDTDSSDHSADELTNFDFDGNLVGRDNWDHEPDFPHLAYAYYYVTETPSHYYIGYMVFHPRDWSDGGLTTCIDDNDQHENDMEGALVVVRRDPTGLGTVVAALTMAHNWFNAFVRPGSGVGHDPLLAIGDDIALLCRWEGDLEVSTAGGGEHVLLGIGAKGHAMYHRLWPGVWDPDRGDGGDFRGGDGNVYVPADAPEQPGDDAFAPLCFGGPVPRGCRGNDREVGYALRSISEIWSVRSQHGTSCGSAFDPVLGPDRCPFISYGRFRGDGGGGCGCGENKANAPWSMDADESHLTERPPYIGEIFEDPAHLAEVYFHGLGASRTYLQRSTGDLAESFHPYEPNRQVEWTFAEPGARRVRVHFDRVEVEHNYDFVEVLDAAGNLVWGATGTHADLASPWVEGDTLKVRFRSDDIIQAWGFHADRLDAEFV